MCWFADAAHASGRAFVTITAGAGFNASTYRPGSFRIRNDSTPGLRIERVTIDLATAMFPDMVFDPLGQAGDVVAKCLEPDAAATTLTGFVVPTDACSDAFSSEHDDGFDVVTLVFTDFDPGEDRRPPRTKTSPLVGASRKICALAVEPSP